MAVACRPPHRAHLSDLAPLQTRDKCPLFGAMKTAVFSLLYGSSVFQRHSRSTAVRAVTVRATKYAVIVCIGSSGQRRRRCNSGSLCAVAVASPTYRALSCRLHRFATLHLTFQKPQETSQPRFSDCVFTFRLYSSPISAGVAFRNNVRSSTAYDFSSSPRASRLRTPVSI